MLEALRAKTILVTGGTGFLGKVVVERLLRIAPDVGRIYLLIRSPHAPPAGRFEAEVIPSGAFDALARQYRDRWPALARHKLVPVRGDVSQPGLGLDDGVRSTLASTVDIIVNAAASVTFDAPLDEALANNTRSVRHVAEFARSCRAAVLVHISTAFVAGFRAGRVFETALPGGDAQPEISAIEEIVDCIRSRACAERWSQRDLTSALAEAGTTRARALGWHDTYTYTKALGEMTLARHRDGVPTAIVRPTIIESSLRDPSPGWIENCNVADPLFIEFGRGRMPDFPVGRDTVVDIVPVDFVANAVLAILPRLAEHRHEIGHYTIGSGSVNPVSGRRLYDLLHEYWLREPMLDRRQRPIVPTRWTFPTPEQFRERFAAAGRRGRAIKNLMYLADLYETYVNARFVFDTSNTERLLRSLGGEDRAALDFDARRIDWRTYVQDIHLPGLRRHVLGEPAMRTVVRCAR
jgi:fatty acyl-CoA reductase